MPTYPTTLPVCKGSAPKPMTDRKTERASNGALRGRVFYTASKITFNVVHTDLKADELATFVAFYEANLNTQFDFTWPIDAVTRACIFSGDPSYDPQGAGLTTVKIEIAEV